MASIPHPLPVAPGRAAVAAVVGWIVALVATGLLHGHVDLGSQSLPIVLAAAWTGLWLRPAATVAACVAAMLGFSWFFVPPVGSLKVDQPQHLLLLTAMLAVSLGVALLVSRQRASALREALQARRVRELLDFSERLRSAEGPEGMRQALQQALRPFGLGDLALLVHTAPAGRDLPAAEAGDLSDDERAGLRLCIGQGFAFGPGTGRYAHQPNLYLPLRGDRGAVGAVVLRPEAGTAADEDTRQQAQALCDQVGMVLERGQALRVAEDEARQAGEQRLRSTLLTAVSHDYRTPLAAILSAASALREQGARMGAAQREQLAGRIVDEVTQLSRITDNALQLARLDWPGVQVGMDWESAEELVGSVLARVRQRDPSRPVKARVEPGLPLVRCNAVLIVQLLENLVDNALKASPEGAPVEVWVRGDERQLVLAVRDRGPGVPPAWRERIFEVFQRIDAPSSGGATVPADAQRPRGAGVGLAVCRAIARVHDGRLSYRARGHGGASFELRLPIAEQTSSQPTPALASMDPEAAP